MTGGPPDTLETLVDALAVHRLTRLVQDDDVPFGPVRELLLDLGRDRKVTELLTCPWCLSVHVAVLVLVLRRTIPRSWPWIARALASSSVTGLLATLTR